MIRRLLSCALLLSLAACELFVEYDEERLDESELLYVQTNDSPEADSPLWRFGVAGASRGDSTAAVRLRDFRLPVAGTDYAEYVGEIVGAPEDREVAYLITGFDVAGDLPEGALATVEVDYAVPDSLADARIRLAVALADGPVVEGVDRSGRGDLTIDGRSVLREFNRYEVLPEATATPAFATAAFTTDAVVDGAGRANVVVLVDFPAGSSGGIWVRHVRLTVFTE